MRMTNDDGDDSGGQSDGDDGGDAKEDEVTFPEKSSCALPPPLLLTLTTPYFFLFCLNDRIYFLPLLETESSRSGCQLTTPFLTTASRKIKILLSTGSTHTASSGVWLRGSMCFLSGSLGLCLQSENQQRAGGAESHVVGGTNPGLPEPTYMLALPLCQPLPQVR